MGMGDRVRPGEIGDVMRVQHGGGLCLMLSLVVLVYRLCVICVRVGGGKVTKGGIQNRFVFNKRLHYPKATCA